jgi:hypothetical protein
MNGATPLPLCYRNKLLWALTTTPRDLVKRWHEGLMPRDRNIELRRREARVSAAYIIALGASTFCDLKHRQQEHEYEVPLRCYFCCISSRR